MKKELNFCQQSLRDQCYLSFSQIQRHFMFEFIHVLFFLRWVCNVKSVKTDAKRKDIDDRSVQLSERSVDTSIRRETNTGLPSAAALCYLVKLKKTWNK